MTTAQLTKLHKMSPTEIRRWVDQVATCTLIGMLGNRRISLQGGEGSPAQLAQHAYTIADAMLEERGLRMVREYEDNHPGKGVEEG